MPAMSGAGEAAEREPPRPTNVLIVGVGGQGVIMVSKVLAALCQRHGLEVKQSEVHGMAKRGGGVFSHVRFGQKVWSPVIAKGEVDILVALEWAEGLRWLNHLRHDGGAFIADTQQIVPPISFRNRRRGAASGYRVQSPGEVLELIENGHAINATDIAAGLGNARAANTVLLGALSTALDFPAEEWLEVIARFVPAKTVEVNKAAFRLGRVWIETAERHQPGEAVQPVSHPVAGTSAEETSWLEITEAWCKGCDICVKICPERCLSLNAAGVVMLADPAACTACRLCEWLCPDFAIRVHVEPQPLATSGAGQ